MTETPPRPTRRARARAPRPPGRTAADTEQGTASTAFAMLPARVLTAGLSHGAIVTYAHLVLRAGKQGYCWPSVAHLAQALARPERSRGGDPVIAPPHRNTVRAYLQELQDAGLIAVEENGGQSERRRNGYRILPLPGLSPPTQDATYAQPTVHIGEPDALSEPERAQPTVPITPNNAQPTGQIAAHAQPTGPSGGGRAQPTVPIAPQGGGYAHPTVQNGAPDASPASGYAQPTVHIYAQPTVHEIYKGEIELRTSEALENRGGEGPPPEPSPAGASASDPGEQARQAVADVARPPGPIPMDASVQRRKAANRIAAYLWEAQGRPARLGSDMVELIEDVLRYLVVPFAGDPRKPNSAAVIEFINYAKTKPFFSSDHSRLTPKNLAKDFGAWLDGDRPKTHEESEARARRARARTAGPDKDAAPGAEGVGKYTSGKYAHLIET